MLHLAGFFRLFTSHTLAYRLMGPHRKYHTNTFTIKFCLSHLMHDIAIKSYYINADAQIQSNDQVFKLEASMCCRNCARWKSVVPEREWCDVRQMSNAWPWNIDCGEKSNRSNGHQIPWNPFSTKVLEKMDNCRSLDPCSQCFVLPPSSPHNHFVKLVLFLTLPIPRATLVASMRVAYNMNRFILMIGRQCTS